MKAIYYISKQFIGAIVLLGLSFLPIHVQGEFLFDGFLIPSFYGQLDTEYSEWEIFYSANLGENYPDFAAPHGTYESASNAGFTPPSGSNPGDPLAFWHASNPTITQSMPGIAFIIGPGTAGNFYSPITAMSFELNDSISDAASPTYTSLGTVVFQFQSEGTPVDLDSIKLVYDNGSGNQEVSPDAFIREYRSSASSFGGLGNRYALQWDISSLGITDYQLKWEAQGIHLSFQQAVLDTAKTYSAVVPEARTWTASGAGDWSNGANWAEGSTSVSEGNVTFQNGADTTVTLDGGRTVAEIFIETAEDVTVQPQGGAGLAVNTGITASSASTGTTLIEADYELGAFNLFDINAGEVEISGEISGAYGLLKRGAGTLTLTGNNTFTEGVGVQGGTLRLGGINSYTQSTSVLFGRLEVAADAPSGSNGALGNATTAVAVGASDSLFSGITEPAELVIVGDHTIARGVSITDGVFDKRLGAIETTNGATFSGEVSIGASDVRLYAAALDDQVTFTGHLTGGAASQTVFINGDGHQGTVVYGRVDKTYSSNTTIADGELRIENGTSTTGDGDWTVQDGAQLRVDGLLGGSGELSLSGGRLTGSGTVQKTLTVGANDVLAPGNSTGTMNTLDQTWAGGGTLLFEINDADGTAGDTVAGWDLVSITGDLDVSAMFSDPFTLEIVSLDGSQAAGLTANFDNTLNYNWEIATFSGSITGFAADAFLIDTSDFQNSLNGSFYVSQSGQSVFLNYEAIPEPGTVLLIGIGLLLVLGRRRYDR